jgi:hypothetical protein
MRISTTISIHVRPTLARLLAVTLGGAACSSSHDAVTAPSGPSLSGSPCSSSGTVQLSSAGAVRVDCANGGTTVTLAGNGASYLVVPQFAVSLVPNTGVSYRLRSGSAVAAAVAPLSQFSPTTGLAGSLAATGLPVVRSRAKQLALDGALRARARAKVASGSWRAAGLVAAASRVAITAQVAPTPPPIGSVRPFRVLADTTETTFKTIGAQLAYAGSNVLIYVDTLSPTNGFSASQLQAFGTLFDQTLYPIDTAAFGPPSDLDQNGRVIVLMTPAVNALTPSKDCASQGFVAGFFDEEDLGGGPLDPNSNRGEIFYSIVPDPTGASSCAHTIADVDFAVAGTFMHELQHLISFSQHFLVRNGDPEYGWLDEGMSIVAEELGSLYYEQKCPGTACRTNPAQIFPDSSQGFIANFLFDSYAYGLRPDTASVTLHSDDQNGFAWRGGDWLLVRWLGDQTGNAVYKRLEQSSLTGVANIESAMSQPFPSLFANFGLALYADSLPGLPRSTAPSPNRFVTRNLRQLWARLFTTSGGSPDIPLAFPIRVASITTDSSAHSMVPGTMSFFRIDTPANAATVSLEFAAPTGAALSAGLHPQLAIFRLPPGQ